jgi:hypothetical protein
MAEEPQIPLEAPVARDRYPRMVIVCAVISAVLSIVIAGTLAVDFVLRAQKDKPEEQHVESFGNLLEKPREAYTPPAQ